MTPTTKHMICAVLAAVLLACAILFGYYLHLRNHYQTSSVESESTQETMAIAGAEEIGNSAYYCTTVESEQTESLSEDDVSIKAKAFSHNIYNPNYEYIGTLTIVVAGTSVSGENSYKIVSVSGELTDEQIDGLTLSEHPSGDTATVVLYLNSISICHFQYRIDSDGTIKFL